MSDHIRPIDPAGRVPEDKPEGCLWLVAGMIPGGRKTLARLLGVSASTPTATGEQRTYDKSGRLDPRERKRIQLIETLERELALQQVIAAGLLPEFFIRSVRAEVFLDAEKFYARLQLSYGLTEQQIENSKEQPVSAIDVIQSLWQLNILSRQEKEGLLRRFQGKLASKMIEDLRAGGHDFECLA